jgi:outer membrane immunogenic protein
MLRSTKFAGLAAGALALTLSAGAMAQGAGSWSGAYLGVHAGGGQSKWSDPDCNNCDTLKLSGALGGLQAGYNMQMNTLLLGFEIDGSATNIKKKYQEFGDTLTLTQSPLLSARARLGFLASPSLMMYLTGGFARSDVKIDAKWSGGGESASGNKTGWVVGGGAEYRISQAMSLRGEVLHYEFDGVKFKFQGGDTGKLDANVTVVRAGLNFHFN